MSKLRRRWIWSFVFVLTFPLLVQAGRPIIQLRLTGGFGNFVVGDANRYLLGWNYRTALQSYITRDNDKLHPVYIGLDWNAEFLLGLGKRFSLGIGSGFIQVRGNEKVVVCEECWDAGGVTSFSNTLSAVPITASFYYHLDESSRLRLSFGAGAGYYFGRWSMNKNEWSEHIWGPSAEEKNIQARSHSLGVHAGISLEWNWMKRLALVAEYSYRYLDMRGFTGTEFNRVDSRFEKINRLDEGTLYYYESSELGLPELHISDGEPHPEVPVKNLREARVDFSGFSLRLGFRVSI